MGGREYGLLIRPRLLQGWIALSTGQISIQWIVQLLFSLILIRWMVIYSVDSARLLMKNARAAKSLSSSFLAKEHHFMRSIIIVNWKISYWLVGDHMRI